MNFKKVLVKDLYRDVNSYVGDIVEVSGWVKTVRDSKSFGFIELNDGSFFQNVQIVFDTGLGNFENIRKLSISSSIIVVGEVIKTENAKQPFEIKASNVEIYSAQQSIAMRTADSSIVVGWTASQTDMLANDWVFAD